MNFLFIRLIVINIIIKINEYLITRTVRRRSYHKLFAEG
jgi:hypothetical protein